MQCDVFEVRLNQLLDERRSISADTELNRHAAACPQCNSLLDGHLLLLDLVRPELTRSVARVEHGRVSFVLSAVAATLLIGFTIWMLRQDPDALVYKDAGPTAMDLADANALPRIVLEATTTQPEDSVMLHDASFAIHQPIIGLHLLSKGDWSQTITSVRSSLAPSVTLPELETGWIDVMAHEMAPVQNSMNSTFNLIRRTLSKSSGDSVNG